MHIFQQLKSIEERCRELSDLLSSPDTAKDPERFIPLSKEYRDLQEVMVEYKRYQKLTKSIEDDEEIVKTSSDDELVEVATREVEALKKEREESLVRLQSLLQPKDPLDEKNIIMEIRAGVGGDEAALFARDLFRMYSKYAESRGWRLETLNHHPTEKGGFKEVIFLVAGKGVFGRLKFERGVHRVQRIPVTEASGRIHTSTATVAVLPEAEEVEIEIRPGEIRVDVFRASGSGGQHVNVTDSAVRITHIPSGIVVSCQDERSQHQNKVKAMKVLRARLLDRTRQEEEEKVARERKSQVGTGERSEKVRTYNFPQKRVSDHRINLSLYNLDRILEGDLDFIIDPLRKALGGKES